MSAPSKLYNALIKTHHITSRKKVAKLKKEAHRHARYVLLRSGGSPGLMYVEGEEAGVRAWVDCVQNLRYKDYQLLRRPAPLEIQSKRSGESDDEGREKVVGGAGDDKCRRKEGFEETQAVGDFAARLDGRGVLTWWRRAMGYSD